MDLQERLQISLGAAYALERELGGGGMSRVFVAEDTALGRKVVVKVLSPELARGISAKRFAREIRFAARLQHPNIVPILTAGALEGLPYYTMPFIEGRSLRARLEPGEALPLVEALPVLRDVARALSYAHKHGVVHRDIKPENLLLAHAAAVVTDFGIAKAITAARVTDESQRALTATLTHFGLTIGTPAYMSPEQAAGDPDVDHRADLYAWGMVAYEALAGRHPFAGKRSAQELITAHFAEEPELLERVRPDVPAELAELVRWCLRKDPVLRPADATELLRVLDTVPLYPTPTQRTPTGLAVASVTPPGAQLGAVAVLPFTNLSADPENEYFADGITDEIMSALARAGSVRVAGRGSSFALKGTGRSLRDIGEQLHVGAVVEGSVRRAGDQLRVTAELTSVADGFVLWSGRYDRELTDVLVVQDEIAQAVAVALRGALQGRPTPTLPEAPAPRGPANIEAYELYLKGRLALERQTEGVARAREYLERAVALDPDFAPTHAGLARVASQLGAFAIRPAAEAFPRARAAAERALELDDTLPEAHAILGTALVLHDWDSKGGEPHLARAIALDPSLSLPRQYRALALAVLGRYDESVAEAERAVRNDPLSRTAHQALVTYTTLGRRYKQAIAAAERAFDLDPQHGTILVFYALALASCGRAPEGVRILERLDAPSHPSSLPSCFLALAYSVAGRMTELRWLRDELIDRSTRAWLSPFVLSFVHWRLGESGEAEAWLRRAIAERDFLPKWAHSMAPLDEYSADPKMAPLLARARPPDDAR